MIIKNTPGFQLKATIRPANRGYSFEMHQHWPQAQRPEWRRICQLNLSESELDALACAIITREAK